MEESKHLNDDLPEGWGFASLGEICVDPQYGWTTSADKNGRGIKLLRTTDISKGEVDWSSVPGCEREPEDVAKYLLSPGDILVSRAGTVGVSYVVKECPRAVFASYLIRFRPLPPISSGYIGYFLKSPQYWDAIAEETAGIAIPNVNASKLKKLKIPLAPVEEQERIVAKIEELLPRVNAVRERLIRVKEIMKRFRQSVLSAACSGRLTEDWRAANAKGEEPEKVLARVHQERLRKYEKLCRIAKEMGKRRPRKPSNIQPRVHSPEFEFEIPESWFWTSLEDVASTKPYSMSSGPFGSALGNKDYEASGVPVIRGKNIQDGFFLLSEFVYISERKAAGLARSYAYPGDLVIVAVGSSGQAATVPENLPRAVLSQNCNKISLDKTVVLSEFVVFSLQIESSKKQLKGKTTDTARPFLSLTNLKKILIAVAPLGEQDEIVRRVESLFNLAYRIEKRIETEILRTERITQAILSKAFRGELVPTEVELEEGAGKMTSLLGRDIWHG
jgi:type I restriction enzyme S subunit